MKRALVLLISLTLFACQSPEPARLGNETANSEQVIQGAETVSQSPAKQESKASSSAKRNEESRARVLAARRKAHSTRDLSSTEAEGTFDFKDEKDSFRSVRLTVRNDPRPNGFGQGPIDPNVLRRQRQRGARVKVEGYRYDPNTCTVSPNYKFQSFTSPDNKARRDRERAWRPKLNIDLFDEPEKKDPKDKPKLPDTPPTGVLIDAGSR